MDILEILARQRDGQSLGTERLEWLMRGCASGELPDYQLAAWAMAVYLRGLSPGDTAALTAAMLHTGTPLTWPSDGRPVVDKHSTGGVGDKVSLVLAPLLACCDLRVPMISGRGLGPTGGTLDKLESIPGFRTELSPDELRGVVEREGCVIAGACAELAPADKRLYALRDVTATVASIPLITASIMSKKLSEGLDALVLDVKVGSGAFMKTEHDAQRLAESLVDAGRRMGVATTALLTDMSQPLGRMVGNGVEVDETLDSLEGRGPADLREVTLTLGVELLVAAQAAPDRAAARERLLDEWDSGRARERFARMVAAQGGTLDAPRPRAESSEVGAARAGYVERINAQEIGIAVIDLGGGRRAAGERIDHSVGLETLVRIGDQVDSGQPLVRLFAPERLRESVSRRLREAFVIGDAPAAPPPLVYGW